jgi:hypothetical protein
MLFDTRRALSVDILVQQEFECGHASPTRTVRYVSRLARLVRVCMLTLFRECAHSSCVHA